MADEKILRLKATIQDIKPAIWRSLEVPAGQSLHGLHKILQAAFGWSDSHLYSFDIAGLLFAPPDPENSANILDSRKQPLRKLEGKAPRFGYTYDFGDNWEHRLEVEAWAEAEPGIHYPRCLGGARVCPPEDCGGAPGYEGLLEAMADPRHEQHAELKAWLGKPWDAKGFDLKEINARLWRLRLPKVK